MARRSRDVEKSYSAKSVAAKLRRLAEALEQSKTFVITIAGESVRVPPDAVVEFEHQRSGNEEEIEIELSWKRQDLRPAAAAKKSPARGKVSRQRRRKRSARA